MRILLTARGETRIGIYNRSPLYITCVSYICFCTLLLRSVVLCELVLLAFYRGEVSCIEARR